MEALDIQNRQCTIWNRSFIRTLISYMQSESHLLIVAGFGFTIFSTWWSTKKWIPSWFSKQQVFKRCEPYLYFYCIEHWDFGDCLVCCSIWLSSLIDQVPFNTPALPTIKTYPVDYNPKFYFIGIIFSIVTTYFAGYFPSRKASKIDPVIIKVK